MAKQKVTIYITTISSMDYIESFTKHLITRRNNTISSWNDVHSLALKFARTNVTATIYFSTPEITEKIHDILAAYLSYTPRYQDYSGLASIESHNYAQRKMELNFRVPTSILPIEYVGLSQVLINYLEEALECQLPD